MAAHKSFCMGLFAYFEGPVEKVSSSFFLNIRLENNFSSQNLVIKKYLVQRYICVVAGFTEEDDMKNNEESDKEAKIAKDSKLSDMDYLKSKVVSNTQKPLKTKKSKKSENNRSVDSDNEEERTKESFDKESMDTSGRESDQDNSDDDDDDDDDKNDDDDDDDNDTNNNDEDSDDGVGGDDKNVKTNRPKETAVCGTIKMRGLPFKANEQHIKDFFAPLKTLDIRILKNNKGKPTGCAFVDFANEKDIKEALKRDRDCIEGRYIELFRDKGEQLLNQEADKEKPWMKKLAAQGGEEEFESIAEVSKSDKIDINYMNKPAANHIYLH